MILWYLYLGAAQGVGGDSAAPPALYCMYALCSSNSMYIVHLSAMSILNCPFFDHEDVAETKIDVAAAKKAPGVPRGPSGSLGGSRGV